MIAVLPIGDGERAFSLRHLEPEDLDRLGLRQMLSQTKRGEPKRFRAFLRAELAPAMYFLMSRFL